jgi:hypothetical protein
VAGFTNNSKLQKLGGWGEGAEHTHSELEWWIFIVKIECSYTFDAIIMGLDVCLNQLMFLDEILY